MARPLKNVLLATGTLIALGALSACESVPELPGQSEPLLGSQSKQIASSLGVVPGAQSTDNMDPISKAAFWGTRYDRNPSDPETAVAYSKALRGMNNNNEALKVMGRFVSDVGQSGPVSLEYGKVLIANDRAFEAVRPLQSAVNGSESNNWQAWSAYGVALDKIGQHEDARRHYDRALAIAPGKSSVLNNKGLSFALSGNLTQAEATLRKAAGTMDGTATVRQNLALVLGFSGRTQEAERLARSDLPPRIADNNAAYFASLVSQPAYWQEFTGDNVEMPDFGETQIPPVRATRMTPVIETAPVVSLPVGQPAAAEPTTLETVPVPPAEQPAPEIEEPDADGNDDVFSALGKDDAQG